VAAALLLAATAAQGQTVDQAELDNISQGHALGVRPAPNPFSLLDFSRIKWSHSYSVSYFSGGGSSGTMGLFNSNMLYEISSKLSLSVNLGIAHTGGNYFSSDRDASFFPGFLLDYHPSSKFRMTLMVQRVPGYGLSYGGGRGLWGSRYGP